MFSVNATECVGFESRWRVKKVSIEKSSQTVALVPKEASVSTNSVENIEVQTDVEPTQHYDVHKLAEFLRKAYPKMKDVLDDVEGARAFQNHYPSPQEVCSELLSETTVFKKDSGDNVLQISALSWNSTGNTIAVSCKNIHQTWCHHNGIVKLYTLDRNDTLSSSHKSFGAQSCVTALRFHPSFPTIIAGGTYTGEIIIWSTLNDQMDNKLMSASGHNEIVTQLSWINAPNSTVTFDLISSSLDSYMSVWSFSATSAALKLKHKYKIRSPIFGKMQRKSSLPSSIANKVDRGIISFDFSKHFPDMFVVAGEGGMVVRCSTNGSRPLKESAKECQVSDPVFKYYQSHEGEITTICFSPSRKEVFATNGSEGEIHLFIIEQEEPAQVIFVDKPLTSISWVPNMERLLYGCGANGYLEIFDVINRKPLQKSEARYSVVFTQMAINMKRMTLVALGTSLSTIQLWSLPRN